MVIVVLMIIQLNHFYFNCYKVFHIVINIVYYIAI